MYAIIAIIVPKIFFVLCRLKKQSVKVKLLNNGAL